MFEDPTTCASPASGARMRSSARTSPINRMGTSVGYGLAGVQQTRITLDGSAAASTDDRPPRIGRDDLASGSRANCLLRTPSAFRNWPKCSSTLAIDTWHSPCCAGVAGVGGVGTRGIPIPPQDQPSVRGRRTRPTHSKQEEIPMTARLYGLWVLSVILALMLEFLTPGMLTLLPVPW